jgi:ABC-type phosphate/phosphonate transport system substrate-binding protein
LCLAIVVAAASPVLAGPRDFVVAHAGEGGTSEQAAPYLEKFLGHAETTLGWPAKSTTGKFFPEPDADLTRYLAEQKPGFGMMDIETFLELKKAEGLQPIATAHGKGKGLGKLHLVVKADSSAKSVDDLKGKTLASNHLQSAKFLTKIAFEGKTDVKKHFAKLDSKLSVLKALKAVENGEAEAALVSDYDEDWRKSSAYSGMKVIWSSKELPPMVVVAFKGAPPKDRDAFAKMLPGMCSDTKGATVCKDLGIDKFAAPNKTELDSVAKKFDK